MPACAGHDDDCGFNSPPKQRSPRRRFPSMPKKPAARFPAAAISCALDSDALPARPRSWVRVRDLQSRRLHHGVGASRSRPPEVFLPGMRSAEAVSPLSASCARPRHGREAHVFDLQTDFGIRLTHHGLRQHRHLGDTPAMFVGASRRLGEMVCSEIVRVAGPNR